MEKYVHVEKLVTFLSGFSPLWKKKICNFIALHLQRSYKGVWKKMQIKRVIITIYSVAYLRVVRKRFHFFMNSRALRGHRKRFENRIFSFFFSKELLNAVIAAVR